MASAPALRFLSLFVPDLADAARRYEAVLGVAPRSTPSTATGADRPAAPTAHPYAVGGPILFELGDVCLALYQCDNRTTHPGDVGIGIHTDAPAAMADRATASGGQVFAGPAPLHGDGREFAVFVLPDRHFFEVIGAERARD